jgi:hypothetical protein
MSIRRSTNRIRRRTRRRRIPCRRNPARKGRSRKTRPSRNGFRNHIPKDCMSWFGTFGPRCILLRRNPHLSKNRNRNRRFRQNILPMWRNIPPPGKSGRTRCRW